MSTLSAEQLEKIAKNRELALLKKKRTESIKSSEYSNALMEQNARGVNNIENKNGIDHSNTSKSSIHQSFNTSATFRLVSDTHFIVDMPFHAQSIEIFKTIPGRLYDSALKKWKFPLSSHEIVLSKLQKVAVVNGIPKAVVKAMLKSDSQNNIDLSKIDKTLLDSLLPFQEEGIRFGISRQGRCLIADDMGLGKTIQALGIAHFYQENWPLLILCPSSMRFPWEEAIQVFLPSVNPYFVTVMTSSRDFISEAKVIICSYDLTKSCLTELIRKNIGVIIMDESHCLKSFKAARTKAALQLSRKSKNVILLSGTPVLSRPIELYTQIIAVDPFTYLSQHDFGVRYCAGKLEKFGWNFMGSSNMEELELYLKKKIMIRRLKSDVISQLPSKVRKVVFLNPDVGESVTKQMRKMSVDLCKQKGNEMKQTLLSYYSLSASTKEKAVCEYISEKLEGHSKMLVFAHHAVLINALCEMVLKKNIKFIRIDGSTNSDMRKHYCDEFQSNEDCRVAILSLRAANSGITLTAANLVIFAELYWNPGELTQAEDRAHRIGQQDSVVIEYLVAKGTVDEHLWKLVQSKLNVLNKVGLSKDNFKEVETENLKKDIQKTLTEMFPSVKNKVNMNTNCDSTEFDPFCLSPVGDEDIFQNIALEEIENQYKFECKKRKTDS